MKIVNIGSMNIDYVYRVDRFLKPGETRACLGRAVKAGGKGLNQSVAAAKAGATVYHAGLVGQGAESLTEVLTRYGVKTDWLVRTDAVCGHTIIQVDAAGQNCILLYGGSNQALTEAYVDSVLDRCDREDVLLLQNETNLIGYAIEAAAERGIRVAMNLSPIDENVLSYPLSKLRWLFVNEIEGAFLTGFSDYTKIMDGLLAKYPGLAIVLTLGASGAWYRDGEHDVRLSSVPVIDIVDTTGAGDTFLGYFMASVSAGQSPEAALYQATYAGALSIQKDGAADSIPTAAEVREAIAGGALEKPSRL
jgi:ribokinase